MTVTEMFRVTQCCYCVGWYVADGLKIFSKTSRIGFCSHTGIGLAIRWTYACEMTDRDWFRSREQWFFHGFCFFSCGYGYDDGISLVLRTFSNLVYAQEYITIIFKTNDNTKKYLPHNYDYLQISASFVHKVYPFDQKTTVVVLSRPLAIVTFAPKVHQGSTLISPNTGFQRGSNDCEKLIILNSRLGVDSRRWWTIRK